MTTSSAEDLVRTCRECGAEFQLSATEQEWFISRGLFLPSRCEPCRHTARQREKWEREGKAVFTTSCVTCNRPTVVPFEPYEGRPVYCYDCLLANQRAH